jgi:hypothetical protein
MVKRTKEERKIMYFSYHERLNIASAYIRGLSFNKWKEIWVYVNEELKMPGVEVGGFGGFDVDGTHTADILFNLHRGIGNHLDFYTEQANKLQNKLSEKFPNLFKGGK